MESKYNLLYEYLSRVDCDVTLSFEEVADILGLEKLAASAYEYQEWWATGDSTHVQSSAWTDAGLIADADIDRQIVTFRKVR